MENDENMRVTGKPSSGEWTWDVQICTKTFTADRGLPIYQYHILAHSMEVQTFTTDRGPPALAMSIAGSKSFCPSLMWKVMENDHETLLF